MATRTINSPGVEIFERDLSLVAQANVGTSIFVTGFASQGYSDEVIKVTTRDELEAIYGTPTNSAERYFYYTVRELLNSPANIYTFRLPYGAGTGDGFGTQHSALVYPVVAATPTEVTTTRNLDLSAGTYFLGKPYQITLSETEFAQAMEGTLFDWSATASPLSSFSSAPLSSVKAIALSAMGGAGIIVLDKAQTTINSQFEGYYVGIADNINLNPASNFDAITRAYTTSLTADVILDYTQIPNGTLQFNLSATAGGATGSISQVMENLTDYNIADREDDDLLNVGVFKLRKSVYATEAFKLDYVLDDRIVGSIDTFRTQLNPNGGPSVPFFLETQDTNSRNVEIMVNPYISNKFTQSSLDSSGNPIKKIRVVTESLLATNYASISAALGITTTTSTVSALSSNLTVANTYALSGLSASVGVANALYPLGVYNPVKITQKIIGNVPTKINRALESIKNDEIYEIDVVVEAGLGTIYTMASAAETNYYDETLYNSTLKARVDTLRSSDDISNNAVATNLRSNYSAIFNQFENFCNLPSNTGGRGDCMFIADPIRHILVTG